MSLEAYKSGRIQDSKRGFISLLTGVSAIGRRIPAALIYRAESSDLSDTWVEDLQDSDNFFFGTSSNSWSNDASGLRWLSTVFDPATQATAGKGRHLLVVDGYSTHVDMALINKC